MHKIIIAVVVLETRFALTLPVFCIRVMLMTFCKMLMALRQFYLTVAAQSHDTLFIYLDIAKSRDQK